LFITSMITDRIGRHEVLLPINYENYNFGEKKNSQVMKERENLNCSVKYLQRGDVNILRQPRLLPAIRRQNTKAYARSNYNFECDWLISTITLNVIGLLNCPMTNCPITT